MTFAQHSSQANRSGVQIDDVCPKCERKFNPRIDSIVECPNCSQPGSTYCCNPDGIGVYCADCALTDVAYDHDADFGLNDRVTARSRFPKLRDDDGDSDDDY